MQSQNAVFAHFTSKQLLPFGFAEQYVHAVFDYQCARCHSFDIQYCSIFIYFSLIETYLYRVDFISSQAIFHMCPVVILLYENKHFII